jgi:uncharacterized ubiquitin-like protein YukD
MLLRGKKSCESGHIADKVLYQVFVNVFNTLVENKDYFMEKWETQIEDDDVLRRVVTKRFIDIVKGSQAIKQFDVDLYFKMVEKMTVVDEDKIVVTLLDESEIEAVIE